MKCTEACASKTEAQEPSEGEDVEIKERNEGVFKISGSEYGSRDEKRHSRKNVVPMGKLACREKEKTEVLAHCQEESEIQNVLEETKRHNKSRPEATLRR